MRPKLFDWVITDPELLCSGEQPQYPMTDRCITFVTRIVYADKEWEFMADGFRYGKLFVWDTLHKRSVPVSQILRWRYREGGRRPTCEEMGPLMEKGVL